MSVAHKLHFGSLLIFLADLGCFAESTNGPRLLPNEALAPSTTTNDNTNCQNACYSASKYWFAGTENGDECWCGNTPPPLASQVADSLCNAACPGDGLDRCGAPGYLSIFYDPTKYVAGTNPALYGPQTIQAVGNYVYQGCYSEATTGRALSSLTPSAPSGGFTIEICRTACAAFLYFGMVSNSFNLLIFGGEKPVAVLARKNYKYDPC